VVAQLTHQTSLNHSLVLSLIVEDFDWLMGCYSIVEFFSARRSVILLHGGGDGARNGRELLQLVHDLDRLNEAARRVACSVNLLQCRVHLLEMTADELIDNLRGQIDPDIKDTVLISIILERILQILLDSLDHFLGSLEVVDVPLVIGLALILIANGAIGKQMIEKLNRQNVDGVEIFQC